MDEGLKRKTLALFAVISLCLVLGLSFLCVLFLEGSRLVTVLCVGLVGWLVATGVFWLFSQRLFRPISELAEFACALAEKNLLAQCPSVAGNDELSRLAKHLRDHHHSLQEFVLTWLDAVEKLAASADELSASSEENKETTKEVTRILHEVASGAITQAERTKASSGAMEEVAQSIQHIVETSMSVSQSSLYTAKEAETGNESLQKVMDQMSLIQRSVEHSASMVKWLGERSSLIGEIVSVITGIASQTNLLSLNAAIEAARAGEHGRGFAVVADEVKKLAEQSEESAAQITDLVQEILDGTRKAVEAMETVTNESEIGIQVVQAAGGKFQHILTSAFQVADQIKKVSYDTEQLFASSQQIMASMDEVSRIAKDTADNVQHVTQISEGHIESNEEISALADTRSRLNQELIEVMAKWS